MQVCGSPFLVAEGSLSQTRARWGADSNRDEIQMVAALGPLPISDSVVANVCPNPMQSDFVFAAQHVCLPSAAGELVSIPIRPLGLHPRSSPSPLSPLLPYPTTRSLPMVSQPISHNQSPSLSVRRFEAELETTLLLLRKDPSLSLSFSSRPPFSEFLHLTTFPRCPLHHHKGIHVSQSPSPRIEICIRLLTGAEWLFSVKESLCRISATATGPHESSHFTAFRSHRSPAACRHRPPDPGSSTLHIMVQRFLPKEREVKGSTGTLKPDSDGGSRIPSHIFQPCHCRDQTVRVIFGRVHNA